MLTYPMTTLGHAHALIKRYRLDLIDWEHGSANGFALFLFGNSYTVQDVEALAYFTNQYREACRSRAEEGQSFDQELEAEHGSTVEFVDASAQRRARLCAFVRDAKAMPRGALVWAAIAELATTAPSDRVMRSAEYHALLPAITSRLMELRDFAREFDDARDTTPVVPGADPLVDAMLRMDIERIDEILVEAPPWGAHEPEWSLEIGVLLALAHDEAFIAESRASSPSGNRRHRTRRPPANRRAHRAVVAS